MTVKVLIGIPARDTVMTGFAHSLAVMVGASSCIPDIEIRVVTQSGTLICDQRSKLAQTCLDDGCDWLMMLDSDMRFPADTLVRMLRRNVPILTANYSTRRAPAEPVAFKSIKTCEKLYTDPESEGLEVCAANGFGVSLIHRSVFEAMEKPWFYIPYIPTSDGHWGEDVWFCNQARKAGFDTLIDHDLSKDVKHIGIREYDYIDAHAVKDEVVALWRAEQDGA